MSHTPYRTGMYSLTKILKAFCRIYDKYRDVLATIFQPEVMVKFDQVRALCPDLVSAMDSARNG